MRLDATPGFRLPRHVGVVAGTETLTDTYVDTPDRRLARAGVALRWRVSGRRRRWQLRVPFGATPLTLSSAGAAGRVPAPFRDLLAGWIRGEPLDVAATASTRRSRIHVRLRGTRAPVADVTVDRVTARAGPGSPGWFREIEVRPRPGVHGKMIEPLLRSLTEAGAALAPDVPRPSRVLGVQPEALPEPPGREASAAEHLRFHLARQVRALLVNDPATRRGEDPESLHQMRVATRRLRAMLRAARPLLQREWADGLRSELDWLGGGLGGPRDLDVLLAGLQADLVTLDGPERRPFGLRLRRLRKERAEAQETLRAALASPRYLALLDRLEIAARAPRMVRTEVSLARLVAREFDRLARTVKAMGDPPGDEELHTVRVRAKRLRYAAELAEGVIGRRAARVASRAGRVQEVLGEHQDAVVAETRVRALVGRGGEQLAALAAGRLVERQRRRRARARKAFPEAWRDLRARCRKLP